MSCKDRPLYILVYNLIPETDLIQSPLLYQVP